MSKDDNGDDRPQPRVLDAEDGLSAAPLATRPAASSGGLISSDQKRQIAEVQAALMIARMHPRNVPEVLELIKIDCGNVRIAEKARYQYARGGTDIAGPNIRLLEVVAQRWGNIAWGVRELDREAGDGGRPGRSTAQSYAWDQESNARSEMTFVVTHLRDRSERKGGSVVLTDERDIYELIANMGSRRKRACLEGVIPRYVIDYALEQVDVTLRTKVTVTQERIVGLLEKFGDFGVTKPQIERRIQRSVTTLEKHPAIFVQLFTILNSLQDGMGVPSDWFDADEKKVEGAPGSTADKVRTRLRERRGGETASEERLSRDLEGRAEGKGDGAGPGGKSEGAGQASPARTDAATPPASRGAGTATVPPSQWDI